MCNFIFLPFGSAIINLINIYMIVILVSVVVSLLQYAELWPSERWAYKIARALYLLTEPAYRKVERITPALAGLDLRPIVLALALKIVASSVYMIAARLC